MSQCCKGTWVFQFWIAFNLFRFHIMLSWFSRFGLAYMCKTNSTVSYLNIDHHWIDQSHCLCGFSFEHVKSIFLFRWKELFEVLLVLTVFSPLMKPLVRKIWLLPVLYAKWCNSYWMLLVWATLKQFVCLSAYYVVSWITVLFSIDALVVDLWSYLSLIGTI